MSNERDQFAEDIYTADRLHKNDPVDLTAHYSYVIADELIAAGYRKPRTITTIEELDALGDRTVVMDRYGTGLNIYRYNSQLTKEDFHYLLSDEGDFVTVLHDPEPTP